MTLRGRARRALEPVIGPDRTKRLGAMERDWRRRAARVLEPPAPPAPPKASPPAQAPAKRAATSQWQPPDPFADFPPPSHSRHDLLAQLHERVQPETYLEVGVRWGDSLTLARCISVGIDPAFKITRELHGHIHLERTTSDEFFAREDPLSVFEGRPVDLAFIDGLHLAEFALRDFINLERHMAPGGVVVFDDMLPRNPLEASRVRKTRAAPGDVFKVVTVLRQNRPDLAVLPVNTSPTGTLVVTGLDPSSTVLGDRYEELVPFLEARDPQEVPDELLHRTSALEADVLLNSVDWDLARKLRHAPAGDPDLRAFVNHLADLPRIG